MSRPLVIAHRGASRVCRENTVDAFVEAGRLGADMVELDVRRAADDVLVVHHDARVPGGSAIRRTNVADLPSWLPTLEEAYEACAGMRVNVEVKNLPSEADFDADEHVSAALAELVVDRGWQDQTLVSSFNLASVDRVREVAPGLATAWLTVAGWDQQAAIAAARERGHCALHPQELAVTAALVEAVHDAGLGLNTWTVDDPARMSELAAMGVDGIVTNVPDVLVDVLEGRLTGGPSGQQA